MATAQRIPLYQAPDGVGYKLLELPQELVDLIESENAPSTLTLTPSPTTALLKTPNKTYSLRQKNTSNGLILLRPVISSTPSSSSKSTSDGDGDGDGDGDTIMTTDDKDDNHTHLDKPNTGNPNKNTIPVSLHAFTTLHETIELVPLEEGQQVPVAKARGKWHERFGRTR